MLCCIAGCHRNKAKYLFEHPKTFHAILMYCEKLSFSQIQVEPQCVYAYSLVNLLNKYAEVGSLTSQQLGSKILESQILASTMEQNINRMEQALKKTPLHEQEKHRLHLLLKNYFQLTQRIKIMVRLVAINQGM